MIKFAHPEYLIYLAVIPVLAVVFWYVWMRVNKRMKAFAGVSTLNRMIAGRSRVKYWLRMGVFLAAIAFLILAMANPQIGTKYEEVTRTGIDLIVAIDVSNSMNAQDLKPSRIEAAKRELNTLIRNLKGDRIGIIVFAGSAYTQLPLTSDYSAAQLLSDVIYTGIAPKAGTAIGSAIDLAIESFDGDESKKHRAMIIITDGENHEDDPIAAAKKATDAGIVIHTIGMGSLEGAPIPEMQNGRVVGFKQKDGETIVTRLDDTTLREIAAAAGGTYTQATPAQDNLGTVFEEIEKMEKKEFGSKEFTAHEDRFQFLLAFGILLLMVEVLLSEKRNRFLARFAVFSPGKD